MPTRILSIPLFLGLVLAFYLSLSVNENYSVLIILFAVLLIVAFVFSPQIDWQWYSRYPPELDPAFRDLLRQKYPFYQSLTPEEKLKFRQRIVLFQMSKDFMPQGMENTPDDLKFCFALSAVHLTFGQEDYLLPKFEKIIIYPHAFPSPQYPERFHASEVFEEDGVVLFSAQHLLKGALEPRQYFPVGWYEMAKVMIISYPDWPWPELSEEIWGKLQNVSGVSREAIQKYINLDDIKALPVSISYFLLDPEKFKRELPTLFQQLNGILKIYIKND